ncbi:MAG TPA: hypothetical protein VGO75_01135 [Gemmatimonadaceae bacterium]|nr:hypothetical protein [Gemmatimonadaceae bacterium]
MTVISVRPPGAAAKARRPAALAREFHWPQCPVGSEVVFEFVFADETIDALESRMLSA